MAMEVGKEHSWEDVPLRRLEILKSLYQHFVHISEVTTSNRAMGAGQNGGSLDSRSNRAMGEGTKWRMLVFSVQSRE
jgi:hypothetical protein